MLIIKDDFALLPFVNFFNGKIDSRNKFYNLSLLIDLN